MVTSSIAAARAACRSLSRKASIHVRTLSTSPKSGYTWDEPTHPNYTIDSIKPPSHWEMPDDEPDDPMAYVRKEVSSAHAIDLTADPPKLSSKDSAVIASEGTIIHGRYGELNISAESKIPLEYLALLHPAAEGAAALRAIAGGSDGAKGTVLVYGAGDAAAMATSQLASADGHAVIGVVGGHQSGNVEFCDELKAGISQPGTIVPEEFALVKGIMRDLVDVTVNGEANEEADPATYLQDFQANLLEYAKYFPADALSPNKEDYTFDGKEKDRKYFDENITAYLSQFMKGSPSFDEVVLQESFTKEQYAIFKSKFHTQTTAVITGDDDASKEFNPAEIVKAMTETPEAISDYLKNQTHAMDGEDFVPYEFSILKNQTTNGMDVEQGGPILGAVINVTPDLAKAAEAVNGAKTLRGKAEALQFLTNAQKNAFAAACSVASIAKAAGKPVLSVGGKLPGLETVEPTDADVATALAGMGLQEDGTSSLNYFLQVYRASDYPVYADYAIHRAQEELSGPRQIVVTK